MKKMQKLVLLVGGPLAVPAFAQSGGPAQPDGSAVISYITAGAAVLLAVIAAKYGPAGAVLIGQWVKRVISR